MGKIRHGVALRPEGPGEGDELREPAVLAPLVVGNHAPHGGVRLDESDRGGRRHYVHGPVPPGERLQQRRREHDVAQEGRLNDEGRRDRAGGGHGHGERGI